MRATNKRRKQLRKPDNLDRIPTRITGAMHREPIVAVVLPIEEQAIPPTPAEILLQGLEDQFREELTKPHSFPQDRDKWNVAPLVPGILLQAILAHRQSFARPGSDEEIRALKAAELLPLIPVFEPEDKARYKKAVDFVETRKILWRALMDGLVTGISYASYNQVAGVALLARVPLSERERAALKTILREGFEEHAKHHHVTAARQLLAHAPRDAEIDVIRNALHSIATNGQDYDLWALCQTYRENPNG